LGFASQTLVASLGGGSTILGNCLMSSLWLKQILYITDIYVGVALGTCGVVILAATSEPEEAHYKMDQLFTLMQAAPFILYTRIVCLLLDMNPAPTLDQLEDEVTAIRLLLRDREQYTHIQ
jgi:hypothetical protein